MIKASCDIIYILSQKALLLKRILKFTENFSQAPYFYKKNALKLDL
jgi:hypothetical protein